MNFNDSAFYREQIYENTNKLDTQNKILDNTIRCLNTTNEIAEDSYNNLLIQKEQIINITDKTTELKGNIRRSSSILSKLKCNNIKNNIIVFVVITILILIIILILILIFISIYLKYIKK